VEVSVSDSGFAVSLEERRRLLEANAAAARFYRRELLRATFSWPLEYLKASGAGAVLSTESTWKVGYAPNTGASLVDHLREAGFGFGTLVRAGLVEWTDAGDAVDRHRDQLMLVARDQRLSPSGFIGIGRDGQIGLRSPVTSIHRPSNVLVGVEEQLDLLGEGAIPVIVDDPVDAIAVSSVSRRMDGRFAGIPVCGAGLSTAQARILRRFSARDEVLVVLSGDQPQRNQAAGYLLDLAFFFDRVRAVDLPAGPGELSLSGSGPEHLHDLLSKSRPLMTYRVSGSGFASGLSTEPDPPDAGPGLG
jgi:DNA primase